MKIINDMKMGGKKLYALWMRFAHLLAVVNTTILLTIIYIVIIGPVGLVMRIVGKDPLDRKWRADGSYWRMRESAQETIDNVRQQF